MQVSYRVQWLCKAFYWTIASHSFSPTVSVFIYVCHFREGFRRLSRRTQRWPHVYDLRLRLTAWVPQPVQIRKGAPHVDAFVLFTEIWDSGFRIFTWHGLVRMWVWCTVRIMFYALSIHGRIVGASWQYITPESKVSVRSQHDSFDASTVDYPER